MCTANIRLANQATLRAHSPFLENISTQFRLIALLFPNVVYSFSGGNHEHDFNASSATIAGLVVAG